MSSKGKSASQFSKKKGKKKATQKLIAGLKSASASQPSSKGRAQLFKPDGIALNFHILSGANKARITESIEQNGGVCAPLPTSQTICLLEPTIDNIRQYQNDAYAVYSTSFITESVKANSLLNKEKYVLLEKMEPRSHTITRQQETAVFAWIKENADLSPKDPETWKKLINDTAINMPWSAARSRFSEKFSEEKADLIASRHDEKTNLSEAKKTTDRDPQPPADLLLDGNEDDSEAFKKTTRSDPKGRPAPAVVKVKASTSSAPSSSPSSSSSSAVASKEAEKAASLQPFQNVSQADAPSQGTEGVDALINEIEKTKSSTSSTAAPAEDQDQSTTRPPLQTKKTGLRSKPMTDDNDGNEKEAPAINKSSAPASSSSSSDPKNSGPAPDPKPSSAPSKTAVISKPVLRSQSSKKPDPKSKATPSPKDFEFSSSDIDDSSDDERSSLRIVEHPRPSDDSDDLSPPKKKSKTTDNEDDQDSRAAETVSLMKQTNTSNASPSSSPNVTPSKDSEEPRREKRRVGRPPGSKSRHSLQAISDAQAISLNRSIAPNPPSSSTSSSSSSSALASSPTAASASSPPVVSVARRGRPPNKKPGEEMKKTIPHLEASALLEQLGMRRVRHNSDDLALVFNFLQQRETYPQSVLIHALFVTNGQPLRALEYLSFGRRYQELAPKTRRPFWLPEEDIASGDTKKLNSVLEQKGLEEAQRRITFLEN